MADKLDRYKYLATAIFRKRLNEVFEIIFRHTKIIVALNNNAISTSSAVIVYYRPTQGRIRGFTGPYRALGTPSGMGPILATHRD